MKKLLSQCILCLAVCLLFSCENKDCCGLQEGNNGQITGTWLLVERGYSPGAGYITEPVSDNPAQTLTFNSNGQMVSTLDGQQDFKYYFVDPDQGLVAFYKHYPGVAPDPSTFTTSYNFSFEGNTLTLYFRYCIEGCHLMFRKVE